MEILREQPQTGSFVPLAEFQSATPETFAQPVLHYYSDRCKLVVLEEELQNAPTLSEFVNKVSQPAHSNEPAEDANGTSETQKTIEDIDVWVTSE